MSFCYLKQSITTPKFFLGLFWALLLSQPFSALAIVYQPGETLNPACAPTDAYCGVAAPITASSTGAFSLGGTAPAGSLFYVAGTSTLQNIIPAGNLQYSIGSPESRLQNVYTNNLILGSASFVMEDVGGVLRFRDVNSVVPGLVIDPSSGATINGNIFINGGATFTNATTTGSHRIGGALVLGGESFQNLVGVGLKVASSTLALDNIGDWAGTFDGQEASYFLANSFSTSSANLWLGGKTTGNLTEGSNLYWTTSRGNQNFDANLAATTTSALAEGANLYYTDTRARNTLSVSAPLSYSASTGAFSLATGSITAPSNPEITIGGGTGAVIGGGVSIVIPEAGATTRGLVSTTTQTFAGDKTFSGNTALSGALNVIGVSTLATSSINSLMVSGTSTLAGITGTNLNIAGNTSLATTTAANFTLSSITPGSLLFAGTGGLISQNNSNLFWDNANSRLGIGLLNPTDTLNVYGGIKTEGAVGAIMAAGSDGAFVYNFGSGISNSLSRRVSQSSDDAEQSLTTGSVNLTSSDLELINDSGVDQEVGIRFQNITIPQGAIITNAYIEFIVDGAFSGTTNLNFYGEAADSAVVFAATTNNITGRTKTSSTVAWSNVPAWTVSGQAQQTPNLTSIIQEIINRAGWLSGNSLAVIVNGTTGSLRRAESYNGNAASAALLVVQYTTNSTNVSYAINNLGPGLFRVNDELNDASPFVVDSSGNVGIGTTTPAQILHIARSTDGVVARFTDANGDCDINPTNTALVCASDASLKKNVLTLDNSLEKVLALNPVTFNWNGEKDDAAEHLGFIAQEVEILFPELVFTDVESGVKSIAYGNFAPILARAIQEIASLADSFKINLIAWFADATNGIADFFAKKIHTEQICLKKSDGSEYCVNGDDLEAMMQDRGEVIQVQPPVAEINLMTESPTATEAEQGLPIIEVQELVSTDTASSTETIIEETSLAVETQSSEEIAEPEADTIETQPIEPLKLTPTPVAE